MDHPKTAEERKALENEGLSYMQLGDVKNAAGDRQAALDAYEHALACLEKVGYKPYDFHYETVSALRAAIAALRQA